MKMTELETRNAKRAYDLIYHLWKNGVDWTKERTPREVPTFTGEVSYEMFETLNYYISYLCLYADKWCKGRHYRSSLRGCVETDIRVLRETWPKSDELEDLQAYVQEMHSWSINLASDLKLNR